MCVWGVGVWGRCVGGAGGGEAHPPAAGTASSLLWPSLLWPSRPREHLSSYGQAVHEKLADGAAGLSRLLGCARAAGGEGGASTASLAVEMLRAQQRAAKVLKAQHSYAMR